MALPIFQTNQKELSLMQTAWASILNAFVGNPANQSLILKNVALTAGTNTVNHRLGRKLQGWVTIRQRADATIYDKQDSNSTSDQTLVLFSSANVVVDLEVF